MSKPTQKLAYLYEQLVARAAATRKPQRANLPGGAQIAVAVADAEQTVTFSRTDKRLGDVELMTFVSHCQIPSEAFRYPTGIGAQGRRAEGTQLRYYVAYRWRRVAQPAAEEPTR